MAAKNPQAKTQLQEKYGPKIDQLSQKVNNNIDYYEGILESHVNGDIDLLQSDVDGAQTILTVLDAVNSSLTSAKEALSFDNEGLGTSASILSKGAATTALSGGGVLKNAAKGVIGAQGKNAFKDISNTVQASIPAEVKESAQQPSASELESYGNDPDENYPAIPISELIKTSNDVAASSAAKATVAGVTKAATEGLSGGLSAAAKAPKGSLPEIAAELLTNKVFDAGAKQVPQDVKDAFTNTAGNIILKSIGADLEPDAQVAAASKPIGSVKD